MIQTILLATDGSRGAERAMHYAASLAKSYRTKVIVLHAYLEAGDGEQAARRSQSIYETRRQAHQLAQAAAEGLRALGAPEVTVETVEGPAVPVIVGAVESLRPDILILGARGLSLWPGAQLGSVSMAVTQRVECAVLVVK